MSTYQKPVLTTEKGTDDSVATMCTCSGCTTHTWA